MKHVLFALILLAVFGQDAFSQSTTTNLEIAKPQAGQAQPNVTIATGFDNFDAAVAGRLSKSVAGSSNVTLTTTEARNAILEFTGVLTGSINVIVPTKARKYIVYNNTSGAFTLTVKTSGGTGIAVTQGTRSWLYCDATNVVSLSLASLAGGAVPDYLEFTEAAAPSTPASGKVRIYAKSDGNFYQKDDAGTETSLATAGGSTLVDFKDSVRVATTANGTLATAYENGDTVDGVVLATGNRILLKDQSTGAENGIYVVAASGAPTRATDADASAEVTAGMVVAVAEGTANADKIFLLTTNDTITLGSTSLSFTAIASGGGGGGAWSAITDPSGDLSLAMGTNLTTLTWAGNFSTSSAYKLAGNNTSASGPLLHLTTAVSNNIVPLLVEPRTGQSLKADHLQNVVIGKTGGMGTSDTDGFPYFPFVGSSGEPTGTPTSISGMAPFVFENDAIQGEYRAWAYLNSGWRLLTPTGGLNATQSGTGAQTINWSTSRESIATRQLTMTGNVTLTFTAPAKVGMLVNLILIQDATGGRTVTWPSSVKWPGGAVNAPDTASNAKSIYQFIYDGTNYLMIGFSAAVS